MFQLVNLKKFKKLLLIEKVSPKRQKQTEGILKNPPPAFQEFSPLKNSFLSGTRVAKFKSAPVTQYMHTFFCLVAIL